MEEAGLVIVGAALGYLASRYQEYLSRRNQKRAIATAILSELRWLEGILRQVYEHGPAAYYDPLEHPIIEAALPQILIFEPETAGRISHFHNLLRDTRALLTRYREAPDLVASRKAEYVLFTKAKAYYAAAAIAEFADALRKEGGRMPPPIRERPIMPNSLPALPPPTFDSFESPG